MPMHPVLIAQKGLARGQVPAPPANVSIGMLALLGSIGTVAYTLVSRAYQIASASVIAPFDYSYLPLAASLGYLLWGRCRLTPYSSAWY